MPPANPLPFDTRYFSTAEEYVASLISFSNDPLLRLLCGGVHILDFFTKDAPGEDPCDLYSAIISTPWRDFFATQDMDEVLELLLRQEIGELKKREDVPEDLKEFIEKVRSHSLVRDFVREETSIRTRKQTRPGTERALYAGMKPKKLHEVENFAAFLDDLVHTLPAPPISHILDYGSGQAYLSRTLSKKYVHNVIGLESRENNINSSIDLDRRYDHLLKKSAKRRPDLDTSSGELTYLHSTVSASDPLPCRHQLPENSSLLLTSLHSCGNLLHHALRAFATTTNVRAVALIGCCHNLLTERHGVTYKTNHLRTPHPRVTALSSEADPAGFPISTRFYDAGITLNITARSMAVQAPYNWTRDSSAGFFKRHFYRALLQRVFADRGLANAAEPVTIGSLRPPAYASFPAYAKAAADKLGWELGVGDEELEAYEKRFSGRWKDLSVVWSLMAFCAGVVESLIVVDRWEFLGEVEGVTERWVEAVFGYEHSPRNLCVVGVR